MFRRIDNDEGRTHELQQIAVKCMRGILFCWIKQADRVSNTASTTHSTSYYLTVL